MPSQIPDFRPDFDRPDGWLDPAAAAPAPVLYPVSNLMQFADGVYAVPEWWLPLLPRNDEGDIDALRLLSFPLEDVQAEINARLLTASARGALMSLGLDERFRAIRR